MHCFQQVYTKKPQVDGVRQVDTRHNDDTLNSGVNAFRLCSLSVSLNTLPSQCHDRYTYGRMVELVYILRTLMWNQGAFHLGGLPKGDATIALVCCMLLPVIKAAIVCILPADCQTCKKHLYSLLICASAIPLWQVVEPWKATCFAATSPVHTTVLEARPVL